MFEQTTFQSGAVPLISMAIILKEKLLTEQIPFIRVRLGSEM